MKKAANIILLVAKVLNLYSHFAIDDPFERFAPTLVFFFMLVCRMVVDWQFVNSSQQVMLLAIFYIKVNTYKTRGLVYFVPQCIEVLIISVHLRRPSQRRFPRPEAMTS